jgi:uncharacterized protein with PIN domain
MNTESSFKDKRFACDAMLCGVSKWLRCFGYDTFWEYGIEDGRFVQIAVDQQMILLTCDIKMMERRPISKNEIQSLLIPHSLKKIDQIRFVIKYFELVKLPTRCSVCGGNLEAVDKESVFELIPVKTRSWLNEYWQCQRCGKLFWKGTHWKQIQEFTARCFQK